ncbi:MAG TPA: hypothetical protein VGM06_18355 [Polyangiaceae bacterium]|jgi:hypothetical protein
MRIAWLVAAGAAIAASTPAVASANGRYPASNQIAFSPSDPGLVVLRTTFGLLLSRDGGGSWQWLCEDALGILSSATEDPVLGVTSGALVATPGLANGLVVSSDTGCDWTPTTGALAGQLVKDLAVRADAPATVVALTSTYGAHAGPDAGAGYFEQVYESADDGASFLPVGAPIDPTALATTLDVAAADDDRLYISAVRSGTPPASLFVSYDHGGTWTERPVPIDPTLGESAIYIGAVDPADPDLVYVRTGGPTGGSRLLVTHDAGLSFTVALELEGPMLGFALSEDGSKVYAGDVVQGLVVAPRDSLAFSATSPIHVQCLATQGAELWACSDDVSGFIAGSSSDDGATFTAKLHLTAPPLLSCAADASAIATCGGAPRQALCSTLPGCVIDAGSPAPPPAETRGGGGGCDMGGGGAGMGAAAAGLACAAILRAASKGKGKGRGRRRAGGGGRGRG